MVRGYRRSVSPSRPRNRTCHSWASGSPQDMRWPIVTLASRSGGSRSSGGSACFGVRPRRGDLVTAIAVSGHWDLVGPVQPRALAAGPVVPPAPSPDLFPGQPRVLLLQPADHARPQVVAEIRQAAAARGVAMVVGPSAQDGVERVDQFVAREVQCAAVRQRLDAVHELAQRSFARECDGDALGALPGSPHDAQPEQVKGRRRRG